MEQAQLRDKVIEAVRKGIIKNTNHTDDVCHNIGVNQAILAIKKVFDDE
jgi:hypothetical protein